MIRAHIIVELNSGAKIKYVRDSLYPKVGTDDGATPVPNQKFVGIPCEYYCYTGDGDDTYDDQNTDTGCLLHDYSDLEASLALDTPKYLSFPETSGATTELVRYNKDNTNGKRTSIRTKILKDKVSRIYIEESWILSPVEPDTNRMLPTWDPGFRIDGWNEDKESHVMPAPTAITYRAPIIISSSSAPTAITVTWNLDPSYATYSVVCNDKLYTNTSLNTYTVTGLTASKVYNISITGVTSTGKTGPSAFINKNTTATNPTISSVLNAYDVELSWDTIPGAHFYRIYKDGTLYQNSVFSTSYAVHPLIPDTSYVFGVKAIDEFLNVWSESTATVVTKMIAPEVTYIIGSDNIVINWTKYKDNYVYKILLDDVEVESALNATTYTFTGLEFTTSYNIKVYAINILAVESPAYEIDLETVSVAPTITFDSKNDTEIKVNWTNLSTGYKYNVYVDGVLEATTLANATTHTVTGLTINTEYDITITAINTDLEEGAVSNVITQTTAVPTPTITLDSVNDTEIKVDWTNLKTGYVYNVYVDGVLEDTTLANATTYTVTGLTINTEYDITVTAVNTDLVEGAASNVITQTTAVPTPVITFGSVNDTEITVDWTNLKTGYVYNVYVDGVLEDTTSANAITYTATGLDFDTEYEITVTAVNTDLVEGAASNAIVRTTSMIAPVITQGTAETDTEITIDWTNLRTGYTYNVYLDTVFVEETLADAVTYTYSGLTPSTEYDLTITAVNASSVEGPVSNTLTISTTA